MSYLPKLFKASVIGFVTIFIALQFVSPARTNPVIDPALTLQPSEPVKTIFARSCNDCHSNATQWPWYSKIAPVSWFISDDVSVGRRQLNFSEWGKLTPRQAENKLEEIAGVVAYGAMPPRAYTLSHPSAKLSQADIQAINDWVEKEKARLAANQ